MNEINQHIETIEIPISFENLNLDVIEIISTLGYDRNNIQPHFLELIDEAILKAKELVVFNSGYSIYKVDELNQKQGTLKVSGITFQIERIVSKQLENSKNIIVFVCTIGHTYESWIKQTMKDDPAKGFIADSVASWIVELAVDYLHDQIKSSMQRKNLEITNRYSPGYCKWSVSEQNKLFSLLPNKYCGIELTESSLMHPIKSISGFIGTGENVHYNEYMCETCGVKDCTYRIIKQREKERKNRS